MSKQFRSVYQTFVVNQALAMVLKIVRTSHATRRKTKRNKTLLRVYLPQGLKIKVKVKQ